MTEYDRVVNSNMIVLFLPFLHLAKRPMGEGLFLRLAGVCHLWWMIWGEWNSK